MAAYMDYENGNMASISQINDDEFWLRVCDSDGRTVKEGLYRSNASAVMGMKRVPGDWFGYYMHVHTGNHGETISIFYVEEGVVLFVSDTEGKPIFEKVCKDEAEARRISASIFD